MKKLLFLLIPLVIFSTACSSGGAQMRFLYDRLGVSDEKAANDTFEKIFNAIQHQDETVFADLFSENVRNELIDLDEDITNAYSTIRGNLVSFEQRDGVFAEKDIEYGKIRKTIRSAYTVKTSEGLYYFAVMECLKDDFDIHNVGVTSVYMIRAEDWKQTYIYRGDGKWTPGINIVEPEEDMELQ